VSGRLDTKHIFYNLFIKKQECRVTRAVN